MQIAYAGIPFDQVWLKDWTRQIELDGPTYLWTLNRLTFWATYSPGAMSYEPDAGEAEAQFRSNLPGAYTDTAIRHLLSQPRQRLIVRDGGVECVRCPATGYTTDARNGPFPVVHSIIDAVGEGKTYLISMTIEFRLNECRGEQPTILSHRWTMSDDISLDHYLTTRTIRGHAYLRSDHLQNLLVTPDDFRAALLHPVPATMQRDSVHVDVDESGTEISYVLQDSEKMFNLTSEMTRLGFTKLDVTHTAEIGKPGMEEYIRNVGGSIARGAGMITRSGLAAAPLAVGAAAFDVGLTVALMIPRQNHIISATGWGNRIASRDAMRARLLSIVFSRMRTTAASVTTGGVTLRIEEEVTGKKINVSLTVKAGLEAIPQAVGLGIDFNNPNPLIPAGQINNFSVNRFISGLANTVNANVNQNIMPIGQETIPNTTTLANVANPPATRILNAYPGRGTFVGQMAAQALQGPCEVPPAPWMMGDIPGNAFDRQ